ncbi:MAG TPA: hypothetical protein VFA94_03100 [Acidimicrobiales bacterium]|nr:hypothetical protein [Acidimicrobiales bacterium]
MGPARAATTGVGTSSVSTTILGVDLGDGSLLNVKLLADQSRSTIDPATSSAADAFTTLTPLHIGSAIGVVNYDAPALETRQPVGQATNERSVSLSPAGLTSVIDGKVDLASLTSAVDANGARSSLSSTLADASLVGGLADVHAMSSALNTSAAPAVSTGTRSINIDALTVIKLADLLKGLGIDITDLNVTQVDALLTALKTAVTGVPNGSTLADTITAIQGEVATLDAAITSGIGLVNGTAGTVVSLLGLGALIPPATVGTITGTPAQQTQLLIDTLNGALATLLNTAATTLNGLALLRVDGVNVGVTTKAADTVANSVATLTGALGSVSVGGVDLPPVNLADTLAQVQAAQQTITDTVNGALATITAPVGGSPVSLQNAVSITLFNKDVPPTVATAGKYTDAKAGITAIKATVKPPVNLAGLVSAIKAQTVGGTSIGALVTTAGGTLPAALAPGMTSLNTTLAATTGALAQGATITAVQVLGESLFAPTPAPAAPVSTPGNTLPRTGGTTVPWAALGLLLVALGLGLRSWFDLPLPRLKPPVS